MAAAKRQLGPSLAVDSWSGQARTEACAWDTVLPTWNCDPPLRGGVGMDTGKAVCTAGFNVRSNSDAKWYVMTAGHCGSKGSFWYGSPPNPPPGSWGQSIGTMHNSVYPAASGNDDFGIIENSLELSWWRPGPYVYVHLSPDTTENSLYPIKTIGGSTKDLRVCVSGAVSGTDCGTVTATGWPVAGGYAVANYCSTGGDSGGLIFSGGVARGIHHGSKIGVAACRDRLYQGIAEATQQLHVYVVHTSPKDSTCSLGRR